MIYFTLLRNMHIKYILNFILNYICKKFLVKYLQLIFTIFIHIIKYMNII